MDKIYECNICNYKTKSRSNLSHHNKTKKHLVKLNENNDPNLTTLQSTPTAPRKSKSTPNNKYVCNYCNIAFTRSSSLLRHKNICNEKLKEEVILKEKIRELSLQLELSNTKVNNYEHYKEEANYYKQMLMEAGGLVKKSVNALTYSITNYNNAPHIRTIEVNDIKTFDNPDKEIVEDILSSYRHKTLNKYLGDLILKLYKKADPLDQSIWNTDTNRLTYIIKELLNDKSSNWIVDKKGCKTVQYLITPLLEYIKKLITLYQKNYNIPKLGQNAVEIEMILENSKKIIDLINDIDDGVIAKEVLKYISNYLKFNDTSLKLK